MAGRENYATTCSQYRTIEKGLPWFAHDSQIATGSSGEGGSQQHLFNSLGASAFPLALTEGLKRLGGDRKGIGYALIKLSPDRDMKPQRNVRLLALPKGRNLLPSDVIGQSV
jgi:hypothetical protein